MPTIRTYSLANGFDSTGKPIDLYLEANNNSEGVKTYELIVRNDTIDNNKNIIVSLDMDHKELTELIKMLQVLVRT